MNRHHLKRQQGFIALYAIVTLTFLVGLVALTLVRWEGSINQDRTQGGICQAERAARSLIERQMLADLTRVPRYWIPPLTGEQDLGNIHLYWTRVPVESRWRMGAGAWRPEWIQGWERLGARRDRLDFWRNWMEDRRTRRDPSLGLRGDLIQDRKFAGSIFVDLGFDRKWGMPQRFWTLDEAGALNRLNLVAVDSQVASALTGVPCDRVDAFQAFAKKGFHDAASAQSFWRFEEWQALEPWMNPRPFSVAIWTIEVSLPSLKEHVVTRWRVSVDESTPGNPWFQAIPIMPELW